MRCNLMIHDKVTCKSIPDDPKTPRSESWDISFMYAGATQYTPPPAIPHNAWDTNRHTGCADTNFNANPNCNETKHEN